MLQVEPPQTIEMNTQHEVVMVSLARIPDGKIPPPPPLAIYEDAFARQARGGSIIMLNVRLGIIQQDNNVYHY